MTFCLLAIFGCAPAPEESIPSSIKILTPTSDRSKRNTNRSKNLRRLQSVTSSVFNGLALNIIDDVDCYTVAVSHLGAGSCNGEAEFTNIEFLSSTVADGGEIILEEIPTNTPLQFLVIGFNIGSLTECPDFRTINSAVLTEMGPPSIVGVQAQELQAVEENIVDITISMDNAKKLNNCGGFPFDWEIGGFFGTARFDQSRFAP